MRFIYASMKRKDHPTLRYNHSESFLDTPETEDRLKAEGWGDFEYFSKTRAQIVQEDELNRYWQKQEILRYGR